MALEDTIDHAANSIMKAVEAYGPQATNLVLETGRIAAINQLTLAGLLLVLAIPLMILGFCFNAKHKNWDSDGWQLAAIAVWMGSSMLTIGAVIRLADAYVWVGLWHPEIYLAAKLLHL